MNKILDTRAIVKQRQAQELRKAVAGFLFSLALLGLLVGALYYRATV